ncbi:MarR family transcriptional regulator [Clostridium sp. LIBA-8841]|uniref:MarR family transcriptional regulator n=1 Tax=Clostridium sp. LIBA-8841 TaxID=2987530 RepID=UPI002AC56721|nr:MarR family transcriptional regulator [Clostridium sp. LIBA-8841]MDZ5254101.1 MarR family transcriptional regulator [Clostridium sp. LIBA-8841]
MNKELNIIDLVSEKHIVLRREVEDRWLKENKEEISHTEAMLLAKISMGKISIAEVARQANVSRQAMFKCAKKLESRGYLKFKKTESNSKYTELTEMGVEYCKKNNELKLIIEKEIEKTIGKENLEFIKEILKKRWIE